ncbi:MAG: Asp23/Gls24 family envelope stress response protein [Erysipelotrichaceae bacterium]
MAVTKNTNFGSVNVSTEAVATLVGGVVSECYGVVGMATRNVFKDGIAELLKQENYSKGVFVKNDASGLAIDVYIIVGFGVKVSEVVTEVQKKIVYMTEKSLQVSVSACNVYVQGIRVIE